MSALCPHNISRGIYISFSSRLSADIVRTYISRDICPHYILLRFSPLVVHLLLDAGLKPNSVLTINYQITPYLSSYLSCQNMYFITIFIKTPLHPPPHVWYRYKYELHTYTPYECIYQYSSKCGQKNEYTIAKHLYTNWATKN